MHIAIVSPYSMSKPGGVQDHCRELARALKRVGVDVTLFGPELRGKQDRLDGIATVSLGGAVNIPANGSIAPLAINPLMLVRFDLALDPADVVHIHEPFLPAGLCANVRRPRNTALVGTFHAAADSFWPYAVASPIVKRAARRLDATTAASPEARKLVRRYVNVDPEIVPNGVDAAAFAAAQPDPLTSDLGRVVLFVGRAEPRKGYETVLRAFDTVARKLGDVHLIWVPETAGAIPPDVNRDRIHCLGFVSRERLMALHKGAEVVLAASHGQESFGITLLEGLAGGSAVLASDIPGYRYAGGDVPVYLPPGDVEAWANALIEILDNDARRDAMRTDGLARAREFDWSSIAARTIRVYERAAS